MGSWLLGEICDARWYVNENLIEGEENNGWPNSDWTDPTEYEDLVDIANSWDSRVGRIQDHQSIMP